MARLSILAFLVVSASGCASTETWDAGSPGQRGAVLAAVEKLYADLSARDWEALEADFWPGATLTSIWRPRGADREDVLVTSVPEFIRMAPSGPGSQPIFEERMVAAQVRVRGRIAQVWSRFHARFGKPGELREWEGIDAWTLLEHDGVWKAVSVSYLADDPPAVP